MSLCIDGSFKIYLKAMYYVFIYNHVEDLIYDYVYIHCTLYTLCI